MLQLYDVAEHVIVERSAFIAPWFDNCHGSSYLFWPEEKFEETAKNNLDEAIEEINGGEYEEGEKKRLLKIFNAQKLDLLPIENNFYTLFLSEASYIRHKGCK